jgi:hypothetical protein
MQSNKRQCGSCQGTGIYKRREYVTWLGGPDKLHGCRIYSSSQEMECFSCHGSGEISCKPITLEGKRDDMLFRIYSTARGRAIGISKIRRHRGWTYFTSYQDVNGFGVSMAKGVVA